MQPSRRIREKSLKWASYKHIKKLWLKIMCVIVPFVVLLEVIVSIPIKIKILVILATVAFFAGLLGMAFGIISAVTKATTKGIKKYEPVIENRISFHELCQEAVKLGEKTPWKIEPHEAEGWIDVTWKWKDSVDLYGVGVNKNEELFYKLFRVYDDYTYEDIDMLISKNAMMSLQNAGLPINMYIGHVKNKQFRVNVGIDSEEGAGIHEYTFDTVQLTNYMHKWFAEHGYAYRGF